MSRGDLTDWTCDRCGVVDRVTNSSRPDGWRAALLPQIGVRSDTSWVEWLDLCDVCADELTEWFKYDPDRSDPA